MKFWANSWFMLQRRNRAPSTVHAVSPNRANSTLCFRGPNRATKLETAIHPNWANSIHEAEPEFGQRS